MKSDSPELYAHTPMPGEEKPWQSLKDHLENVATIAGEFAGSFGFEEWGYALGILHDIGKADERFQRRLKGDPRRFDHPAPGALFASEHLDLAGSLFAPLILGHHKGIPNVHSSDEMSESLTRRLAEADDVQSLLQGVVELPSVVSLEPLQKLLGEVRQSGAGNTLESSNFVIYTLCRFLHSALVDADWLDTEAYVEPAKCVLRQKSKMSLELMLKILDEYLTKKQMKASPTPVNDARTYILESCRAAADYQPGLFTLEVPTGSGKTLSSLAFALRHAIRNGQKRIIYAIPFTSIVEQTAAEFRSIFGDENVLEHHSNYDFPFTDSHGEEIADRDRLLVQNWDAPLIVTTNVQLFESLFSHRPSKSRKVHNIAESVIILDEAQTLPDNLLKPTLAMIETLPLVANISVVLCTATQPSLESLWPFGACPQPLVKGFDSYESVFSQRVQFDTQHLGEEGAYSLDSLTREVGELPQALVVVSSRQAARQLYDALSAYEGKDNSHLFHLSALMVPAHRSEVIAQIRTLLREGKPCTVVSTQLIEAGVDVDFPCVYREIAGIDSVLQAAGRCNREGKKSDGPGIVTVFSCREFDDRVKSSKSWLGKMRYLGFQTIQQAKQDGEKPFGAQSVKRFFDQRHQTTDLDEQRIYKEISQSEVMSKKGKYEYRCDFANIDEEYRFIDNKGEISLFIPWGEEGLSLYDELIGDSSIFVLTRRLQRYSVSIPSWKFNEYEKAGVVKRIGPWYVLETGTGAEQLYDEHVGLKEPGGGTFETLIY